MKSQRSPRPLTVGSAFLASVALLGATAEAQVTSTWTGGGSDNNWGTAANWTGGVPTSSGNTVLVFSGSTRTTSNNNLTSSFNIGQLQFGSGAAAFTLSGDMIGFQPYLGSQTQQIIQASPNTQTISTTQISFAPARTARSASMVEIS